MQSLDRKVYMARSGVCLKACIPMPDGVGAALAKNQHNGLLGVRAVTLVAITPRGFSLQMASASG